VVGVGGIVEVAVADGRIVGVNVADAAGNVNVGVSVVIVGGLIHPAKEKKKRITGIKIFSFI